MSFFHHKKWSDLLHHNRNNISQNNSFKKHFQDFQDKKKDPGHCNNWILGCLIPDFHYICEVLRTSLVVIYIKDNPKIISLKHILMEPSRANNATKYACKHVVNYLGSQQNEQTEFTKICPIPDKTFHIFLETDFSDWIMESPGVREESEIFGWRSLVLDRLGRFSWNWNIVK